MALAPPGQRDHRRGRRGADDARPSGTTARSSATTGSRRKLLGLDQLYDYDRYAPLFADLPTCDWPTARQIVEESYERVQPQGGRRSSASSSTSAGSTPSCGRASAAGPSAAARVPSVHPYILMNYTDKLRDVMTLAHELGHGLHQYLSRGSRLPAVRHAADDGRDGQRLRRDADVPAAASRSTPTRARGWRMLCSKIEDGFATVFRQVVLTALRAVAAPGPPRAGRADHRADQRALAGRQPADARRRREADRRLRLVVALHRPLHPRRRSTATPTPSASCWCWRWCRSTSRRARRSCRSTWSCSPRAAPTRRTCCWRKLGVDVTDPAFWELGLGLLDDMVTEAESLAEQVENAS